MGPYIDYTVYDGVLGIVASTTEAGQSLTVQLTSSTSHAAMSDTGGDGWMLSLLSPGADSFMQLGLMHAAGASDNASLWEFTVAGSNLTQVGDQIEACL